jgi:hypothetical protein
MIIDNIMLDNRSWELAACLNEDEVNEIIPLVLKLIAKVKRLYDFYLDVHEGGEATDRQITKMIEYEDRLNLLQNLYNGLVDYASYINNIRNKHEER